MPEGNLVGSSGKAQKDSYGKVGKKKVVVKPKPKPPTQKPQHAPPPQDLRSPDAKQPTTAAEKRAAVRSAARAKRQYARSLQPTLTTAHNPRGPKLTRDEELALAVDIAMGREPSFEASARATRHRHGFDTAMMVATGVGRGDRLFSNQYGDQKFNDPWDYANAAMLLPFGRPARGAVAAAVGARAITKGGAKEGVEAAAKYYSGEGILRPLSRTRMARRIMRLNPDIGFAKAARLAAEESRKPGMLAAHGIKGGVAPRILEGAKGEAAGIAQSQSTLGRGLQGVYDATSRKIDRWRPTAKFSTSHRAAKVLGLEQARRTKMLQNEIARLERVVNKALPGVFQGSVRKTTPKYAAKSRPLKEALLAAHEAPDFMSAREAVETKIQDLNDLAAHAWGGEDGSGAIAAQLNDQISYLEKSLQGDILESDKFAQASDAMAEMSAMGEDIYARVYPDVSPADMEARKNIVMQRWHDQGLLEGDNSLPLIGLPKKGTVSPELQDVAQRYSDESGIPYNRPSTYQEVDPERASRIAKEYEDMPNVLKGEGSPEYKKAVDESYNAFVSETHAQLEVLNRAGYTYELYPMGADGNLIDPYGGSPWGAVRDLRENKHLYVYPSGESGGLIGSSGDLVGQANNPLMQKTGTVWKQLQPDGAYKDVEIVANTEFRGVHDTLGHAKEGVGFRADGEENAWRSHAAMYSDTARPAMTTETRGQNSWVNFGPHGVANQSADQLETVYADQKIGLMSPWTWQAGLGDHARGYFPHKNLLAKIGDNPSMAPSQFGAGVAGVPQKTKTAFETRKNELLNYEHGDIQAEPRALSNTVRSRVRYENTVETREFMWKNGQPVKRGQDIEELIKAKNILVRNPHHGAEKIPDEVRAALDDPQKYAEWAKDWIYDGTGAMPQWVHDVEHVRTFPESLARALVGDAFAANPPGNIAAMWSMVGALPRLALIYSPYGGARYTVRNTVQNMVLLAVTHPTAFREFNEVITGLRRVHPDLYNAIKAEAGTPLASAGLPAMRSTAKGAIQKTAKAVSKGSQKAAETLGNIADEPYRVMSWLRYAKSYGFESPEELNHLLTSRAPEITQVRNNIAQFVRDDMLDFDALPVKLQQALRGFAFLPSFTYAAAKWPVMFAREYPVRAAVLALLTAQRVRETGGWEQSNTFDVSGKPVNTTWIHPLGPVVGFGQDMHKISESSGPGELTASIASAAGNPILRQAINPYSSWEDILKVITPGWSTVENLKSSRSPIDKLLKATGSQVEDYKSQKTEKERAKSAEDYVARVEKANGAPLSEQDVATITQWKKNESAYNHVRSQYEKNSDSQKDGLTDQDTVAVLLLTFAELNPDKAELAKARVPMALASSDEEAAAAVEALRKELGLSQLGTLDYRVSKAENETRTSG